MKRLLFSLAAASTLFAALPPVAAAPWVSINERLVTLEKHIDQGIRSGTLTRSEAQKLRGDFLALVRIEVDYRRSDGVLTMSERMDLDRRFDTLSRRIRSQKRDAQVRETAWLSLNERKARIYERIEEGIRKGQLTHGEASRMKDAFGELMLLEAKYRRSDGGLTQYERDELERRMLDLLNRIDRARLNGRGR